MTVALLLLCIVGIAVGVARVGSCIMVVARASRCSGTVVAYTLRALKADTINNTVSVSEEFLSAIKFDKMVHGIIYLSDQPEQA